MLQKLSLFKNASLYLLANLINSSIPFLLIPILTKKLSPAEYGIIAVVTLFINFLTPFVGLSVHGAITRKFFVLQQDEFRDYISNCLILVFSSAAFFALILYTFRSFFSMYSGVPEEVLLLTISICLFQYLTTILLATFQVKQKPIKYGSLQISSSALNFGLSFVFIVLYHQGWQGRLYGWTTSTAIFGTFAFIMLINIEKLRFTFNKETIKDILNFSLPLIPHTLGGLLIAFSDRLIIKNVMGLSDTGIYTLAFQIGSILGIMLTSFNAAFVPWLFAKLKQEDDKIKLQVIVISYYLMAGILTVVPLIYWVTPFVFDIFVGDKFKESANYLFWILLSFGFNGLYYLVANYIFYANKTRYLAMTTFSVAMINIPLCYFFTKQWGLMGAVQSTAIAWFLLFSISWILSNRVYPMPWRQGISNLMNKKLFN